MKFFRQFAKAAKSFSVRLLKNPVPVQKFVVMERKVDCKDIL